MALTNAQYEKISRGYENRRTKNRHLLNDRRDYVYSHVDGYRELEDSVAGVSVEHGKRLLSGDESAIDELHAIIEDLSAMKRQLLISFGLPENYLEPIYDCPVCQDTGYVDGQKCNCFKQQMVSLLYEQSNIQDMLGSVDFSCVSDEYYKGEDLDLFRQTFASCHDFAEQFGSVYQNLLLYGTVGTGKSFLSGCIAKVLLEKGYSVIYFSAVGLFELLAKYSFDTKNKDSLYNMYEDLYNCDLVIIDDLGTEVTNSFVASQLFSCLNERHLRHKSTLISTNLSLAELKDRYSDRIFSRITSNYLVRKLSGPDIRMYKNCSVNRK